MNQEQIGKFIKESREHKNLTQVELGEKLGLTDKSISRWEHGKTMPDISLLNPLAIVLDVSVQELLNGRKMTKDELFELKGTIENLIEYESDKQIKKNIKTNKYIIIGDIILVIALLSRTFHILDSLLSQNTIEFIHGFLFSLGITLNLCGVYNNSHSISICEKKKAFIKKLRK